MTEQLRLERSLPELVDWVKQEQLDKWMSNR